MLYFIFFKLSSFTAIFVYTIALISVFLFFVTLLTQFGAEFRRFSLDRSKPGRFDEFYGLLQHVHRIPNVELLVGYADVHGDLLPINNDDNYHKAISTASPLLRLFLQRKGERCPVVGGPESSACSVICVYFPAEAFC